LRDGGNWDTYIEISMSKELFEAISKEKITHLVLPEILKGDAIKEVNFQHVTHLNTSYYIENHLGNYLSHFPKLQFLQLRFPDRNMPEIINFIKDGIFIISDKSNIDSRDGSTIIDFQMKNQQESDENADSFCLSEIEILQLLSNMDIHYAVKSIFNMLGSKKFVLTENIFEKLIDNEVKIDIAKSFYIGHEGTKRSCIFSCDKTFILNWLKCQLKDNEFKTKYENACIEYKEKYKEEYLKDIQRYNIEYHNSINADILLKKQTENTSENLNTEIELNNFRNAYFSKEELELFKQLQKNLNENLYYDSDENLYYDDDYSSSVSGEESDHDVD